MQFLPGTWAKWGADGDDDGTTDPQNVFDATLAAGRYLCAGSGDLSTADGLHSALLRYNDSEQYANTVTQWINSYAHGGIPVPDRSGSVFEFDQYPAYQNGQPATGNPPPPPTTEP